MAIFARRALSEADLQAMAAIANGVLGIKRKQAEERCARARNSTRRS